MCEIYNRTPHDVAIFAYVDGGLLLSRRFPKVEGVPAPRVVEEISSFPPINGFEVVKKTYSGIEGLPEEKDSIWYIVSGLVLQAAKGKRHDLLCPDTGPDSVVRDEIGRIIGVRRFQTN